MTTPDFGFGAAFDQHIELDTGRAAFGQDVLSSLVEELDEAACRPRTERNWGPSVLGCAMWMDDPDLLDVLGRMANVCVVVTKQRKSKYSTATAQQVKALAVSNGLTQSAYPELSELARPVDGQPLLIGPYSPAWDTAEIGAVREVGYRKVDNHLVPIVHAKMLLLGRMGWTDEHPAGGVGDILYFVPERLWIGSANFTLSSRKSLEMGIWTSDPTLLGATRDWLLNLISISEPFGASSDHLEPELVSVEYDDAALIEYLHESGHDQYDDEDQ